MRKITSLLVTALLAVFAFSCQLPKSSVPGEAASLTLEQKINQEYPYWKVYISSFEAQPGVTLRVDEKKTLIKHLATIRFLINTPEFQKSAYEYGMYGTKAWRTGEYPGGEHNVTYREQDLGRNRILETIQKADYKVRWIKKSGGWLDPFQADLGDFYYVFLGYKPIWYGPGADSKTPPRILIPNDDYVKTHQAALINSIFHEHLHHLGYQHDSSQNLGGGVPYEFAWKIKLLYYDLEAGKLTHFVEPLKKLVNDYFELYKDFLQEDTVGGTTRAVTVSDNDDHLVSCSHENEKH